MLAEARGEDQPFLSARATFRQELKPWRDPAAPGLGGEDMFPGPAGGDPARIAAGTGEQAAEAGIEGRAGMGGRMRAGNGKGGGRVGILSAGGDITGADCRAPFRQGALSMPGDPADGGGKMGAMGPARFWQGGIEEGAQERLDLFIGCIRQ